MAIIFAATDGGPAGRELWITNGTTAGTLLLKDINPGVGDFEPDRVGTIWRPACVSSQRWHQWP